MKKLPKKVTLLTITISLTLIVALIALNQKSISEAYWIYQLENGEDPIRASRELAELKCYRAIPLIVQEMEKLIEEDTVGILFVAETSEVHVYKSRSISDFKREDWTSVHPLLYSVYLMGRDGEDQLVKIQNKYQDYRGLRSYPTIELSKIRLLHAVDKILLGWKQKAHIRESRKLKYESPDHFKF